MLILQIVLVFEVLFFKLVPLLFLKGVGGIVKKHMKGFRKKIGTNKVSSMCNYGEIEDVRELRMSTEETKQMKGKAGSNSRKNRVAQKGKCNCNTHLGKKQYLYGHNINNIN